MDVEDARRCPSGCRKGVAKGEGRIEMRVEMVMEVPVGGWVLLRCAEGQTEIRRQTSRVAAMAGVHK